MRILAGLTADVEQVANIILEEAGQTRTILPQPAPVVLFDPGVTPTHLEFKLVIQVASRAESGGAQSEVRVRILARFRREGVPLPSVSPVAAAAV